GTRGWKMIMLKNPQEIDVLRKSNDIVAVVRDAIRDMAQADMTTLELDHEAENLIMKSGAKPAFKGYRGYPNTICISINDEVVHGIPGKRRLKMGDVVSIDMGVLFEGFFGDSAMTFPIGEVGTGARKLIRVTEEALYRGIEECRPGRHLHDIGAAIQEHCEAAGFSVVRDFVGHGIGRALHEDPQIPNYGTRGTGPKLVAGMVLAIEPMVNEGAPQVRILDDGWTAVTADGKLSAHFEHSVAVTQEGPIILSQRNSGRTER
ncbi:MAG: type I methionyl aminopeptidase, partial [Pseudomonadota bacterium]